MSVLSLISSIIKEIKSPAFKIESEDVDDKTGLIFFWVQVVHKCVHPAKKDPINLLRASRSKNCFSEADYDSIIAAMLENQKRIIEKKFKSDYSLIKHQFSEQLEEPLILFKDINNKIHIKPAKKIYSTIEELRKFNSRDSACIGNIVGGHEAEQEYKFRSQNKNDNVVRFDTSHLCD